jgi:hypothetical protein
MKSKKILGMILIVLFVAIGLFIATPAGAFNGVSGHAFDGYGNPWIHGGQVLVFNNTTGQLVASGDLVTGDPANNGRFDFPYTQTTHGGNGTAPLQGHSMSVVIVYNDGGVGTPLQGQQDYTELTFIPGRYSAGDFDTGTGPSAVTFSNFKISLVTVSVYPLVVLLFVIGTFTAIVVRRRSQYSA